MRVIAISGKAQHGKDTTAGFLKSKLEEWGGKVLTVHYADLLKFICRTFFYWNGKKDDAGRHILQYVGTDVIRTQRPDFWVDFVVDMLKLFPDEWDYVLIPDCRFPNEIEVLKKSNIDTVHLRVIRNNFKTPLTEEQQKHLSETALDNVTPDYYIYNRGTLDELNQAVSDWVMQWNGYHQISFDEYLNEAQKG